VLVSGCLSEPTLLDKLVLRPSPEEAQTPADLGYAYDEVRVSVAADRHISLWHVRAESPRAVVVILPGSDRNRARYLVGLPVFLPNGYDVVLMDYEGFGAGGVQEPGDVLTRGAPVPTLAKIHDDAAAAFGYAKSRHERVVVFGASIGTTAAARIAAGSDVAAVILEGTLLLDQLPQLWLEGRGVEAPFLWRLAEMWMRPQIPDGYDTLDSVRRITAPKLFLHSAEDEVTPIAGARLAFEAAPAPKEFWEMRGEHGKMIELDPEAYERTIIDWLDAQLAAAPPRVTATAAAD
jgi:hypothetical protein